MQKIQDIKTNFIDVFFSLHDISIIFGCYRTGIWTKVPRCGRISFTFMYEPLPFTTLLI